MFFQKAASARQHATLQRVTTGKHHVVALCRKYLCPPKKDFGRDYITGFTVILCKKT